MGIVPFLAKFVQTNPLNPRTFLKIMRLYKPFLILGMSLNGTSPDRNKDNPQRAGPENPSNLCGQLMVGLWFLALALPSPAILPAG